jgi:hypothetical protein
MELEAAAGQSGAFLHAQQAQTSAMQGSFPNAGHMKTDTIVTHG